MADIDKIGVIFAAVLFALIVLSGCIQPKPPENLGGDNAIFDGNAFLEKCSLMEYDPFCLKQVPEFNKFSCRIFYLVPEDLRWLNPPVPLMGCSKADFDEPEWDSEIYRTGCMLPQQMRYIAMVDGQPEFVKDKEDFRRLFGPVESELEAISFAAALTPYEAYFDASEIGLEDGSWLAEFEGTHAEKTVDGWSVNLFQTFECGCHDVEMTEHTFLVKTDGTVEETSSKVVWKGEGAICVD